MFITNRQRGIAKQSQATPIFNEEYIDIMQARDFRQGNIVIFSGKWQRIESIGKDSIVLNGQPCRPSDVEPIVLDGALLVRCGFEAYCDLFGYPLKRYFPFLLKKKNVGRGYSLLYDYRAVTGLDFLYLHQLQNLFFAFTGIELHLSADVSETGAND